MATFQYLEGLHKYIWLPAIDTRRIYSPFPASAITSSHQRLKKGISLVQVGKAHTVVTAHEIDRGRVPKARGAI